MRFTFLCLFFIAIALLTLAGIEGWRLFSPHLQPSAQQRAISPTTLSGSRQWIILNDDTAPLTLSDAVVNVSRGSWFFGFSATTQESIIAYEMRWLMFDVLGEYLDGRDYVQLVSIAPGESLTGDGLMPIPAERLQEFNQRFYSSVAFVTTVRAGDGQLWRCDAAALTGKLEEIGFRLPPPDPLRPDAPRVSC